MMNLVKNRGKFLAGVVAASVVVLGIGGSFFAMHQANIATYDETARVQNELVAEVSAMRSALPEATIELENAREQLAEDFLPVLETIKLAPPEIMAPNERTKVSSLTKVLKDRLANESENAVTPPQSNLPELAKTSAEGAVVNRQNLEDLEEQVEVLESERDALGQALTETSHKTLRLVEAQEAIELNLEEAAVDVLARAELIVAAGKVSEEFVRATTELSEVLGEIMIVDHNPAETNSPRSFAPSKLATAVAAVIEQVLKQVLATTD